MKFSCFKINVLEEHRECYFQIHVSQLGLVYSPPDLSKVVSETQDSSSIFVQADLLPSLGQFGQLVEVVCTPSGLYSYLLF